MDYAELAMEYLQKFHILHHAKFQKDFSESMRGELLILQFMARHDGIMPSVISHKMNISSARITAALNSLESKGLVTREIDKKDRRRIIIKLTPTGKEQADKHQQKCVEYAASMLRLLGEHDAREYVRITGKLADLLQTGETTQHGRTPCHNEISQPNKAPP